MRATVILIDREKELDKDFFKYALDEIPEGHTPKFWVKDGVLTIFFCPDDYEDEASGPPIVYRVN